MVWFPSCKLAEKLIENKLTMVSTLRKNKKEIPLDMISVKNVPLLTSLFLYQPDKMLVSFTEKKNKNCILISTMHDRGEINQDTKKPNIIEFYNVTKGGLDVFHRLCNTYSTKRATSCWPMRLAFILSLMQLQSTATSYLCYVKRLEIVPII